MKKLCKPIKENVINHPARFQASPDFKGETLQKAINTALAKVDYMMEQFGNSFPKPSSVNNDYPLTGGYKNYCDWTEGFWTGILWLAWEITKKDKYSKLALSHLPEYRARLDERIVVDHHDMGFLYIPSCVAAYKLVGDEFGLKTALMAADKLMERYQPKGRFIQAWGKLGDPQSYRLIIDCLLNIPLLYWASEHTGDDKYRNAAYAHFNSTVDNALREDGTSFHTFYFNPETGAPLRGATAQGASDDSCWSRGQAWGIYGLMLTRAYVDHPDAIVHCKNMTNVFLNGLPTDFVPYWDLIFTEGDEPRDSSAAAIAVCGMLELLKYLPDADNEKKLYENAVNLIMHSLYENYSTMHMPESTGLLLHATYSKPGNNGVDECCIWGDYFYMEALVRLYKNWNLYW